jgi:diaminopimelate epimerase
MLDFSVDYGKGQAAASIVNTGEPHIVVFTEDIGSVDVVRAGEFINSNRERFPLGVNINFVQVLGEHAISVRTYERGVYNESMACGTGATACACVSVMLGRVRSGPVSVKTLGGLLKIEMTPDGSAVMTGPATRVFDGSMTVEV